MPWGDKGLQQFLCNWRKTNGFHVHEHNLQVLRQISLYTFLSRSLSATFRNISVGTHFGLVLAKSQIALTTVSRTLSSKSKSLSCIAATRPQPRQIQHVNWYLQVTRLLHCYIINILLMLSNFILTDKAKQSNQYICSKWIKVSLIMLLVMKHMSKKTLQNTNRETDTSLGNKLFK